jgi:signal transduction histidine kinase
MVGAMRRSIDAASRTIDELLRAATAQRGGTSAAHGCADLTEVYAELENDLAEELRKVGGRASSDFPGCPKIAMERGNLKSILMNLMTNALKFRSPERRLEIQLRTVCTSGFVVLSVVDNGIGIDLDHAGENPLRERRNPNIEGSGLGLRLVEEMVEAAGGHIEVESALNRGATFRVWLPEASRESERA